MQLALFDFDHTITETDTYAGFLRRVVPAAEVEKAKLRVAPWLLAYRARLISAAAIRRHVTRLAFTGRSFADVAAQGAPYAELALPNLVRPLMMQQIEWHQALGHRVAVVSASLDLYLRPWCERHGLDVICNRLEHHAGQLTGRYADDDCGPHKVREIRKRYDLSRFERVHAYGDSREDKPMLALAHERWYRGRLLT